MNRYKIHFEPKGSPEKRVTLPINPQKITINGGINTQEYDVLGIGEVVQPRLPKLRTFEISSYFPGVYIQGVTNAEGWQFPEYYIQFFKSAMDNGTVLTFLPERYHESGLLYARNVLGFSCIVKSFSYEERAGETGDFYYSLSIQEYKDFTPAVYRVAETSNETLQVAKEPTRETPLSEIVVGSICVANGRFYASSYGQEPHGNANGRRVKVSRIVTSSRAYPYHITTESGGWLGWIKKDGLQVVSNP